MFRAWVSREGASDRSRISSLWRFVLVFAKMLFSCERTVLSATHN